MAFVKMGSLTTMFGSRNSIPIAKPKFFCDLVSYGWFLLLDVIHGRLVDVAQLDTILQLPHDELLQRYQIVVDVLDVLAGVDQHRPDDVGAVGLVPNSKRADDGPEMDVLLVADHAELLDVLAGA